MRSLLAVVVLSLAGVGAVPPQEVTWTQDVTPSRAQSFIYRLYIMEESGNGSVVQLASTLCGTVNGTTECSTALPAAANAAIVSNNRSQLTAVDPTTGVESPLSVPFVGDQGCIFRDNLYAIGKQATGQSNKQNLQRLLDEFRAAKFRHIRTENLKGNQFLVTEECVGKIQN